MELILLCVVLIIAVALLAFTNSQQDREMRLLSERIEIYRKIIAGLANRLDVVETSAKIPLGNGDYLSVKNIIYKLADHTGFRFGPGGMERP